MEIEYKTIEIADLKVGNVYLDSQLPQAANLKFLGVFNDSLVFRGIYGDMIYHSLNRQACEHLGVPYAKNICILKK